ncbi:MAG: biotin--[acetyl-CoA-carboxylase] ligase [Firmicutes bacterium]|nr:biotin--[acetyl-CoA-carboxylase] ligase [Bacillota bacterium]
MKIIHYKSLLSTNDLAKKMAIEDSPHGTAIIADTQESGRGRIGKNFASPIGGVYMSVIIGDCNGVVSRQTTVPVTTLLTVAAAVAVIDAIKTALGIDAGIKWVNDIFYEGKKVGGILTETAGDSAVVGVGLNLRTKKLPADLPNAGSLLSVAGDVTTKQVAEAIQKQLLDILADFDPQAILDKYRQRSILIGKRVLVTAGDISYEATAVKISDDGALVVEKDDGAKTALTYGEANLIIRN